jgi:hypothetical protein
MIKFFVKMLSKGILRSRTGSMANLIRLKSHPKDQFICLAYHRVCEAAQHQETFNPINRRLLEQQVDYLLRYFNVLPLDEIIDRLDVRSRLYNWPLAITFDGGWPEIFSVVKPLFDSKIVPASVYVPLEQMDSGLRPWYERIVANVSEGRLRMDDFSDIDTGTSSDVGKGIIGDTRDILKALSSLTEDERAECLNEIETKKKLVEESKREVLSWEQLSLLKEKCFKIGIQIPPPIVFNNMANNEQARFLTRSIDLLKKMDDRQRIIISFGPNWGDFYSDFATNLFKKFDVFCATTHVPGRNSATTNRYQLYRLNPHINKMEEFILRLYQEFLWPGEFGNYKLSRF